MIVSLNWLKDYVELPGDVAELADRLALSGLNHESFDAQAIDLEVTSNRPDCLGHVGVAREIGVLYGKPLTTPAAKPQAKGGAVAKATGVELDAPELCPRYTARLIRGVKVGPSPAWLADRLRAVGIAVINNVVDATNYVLMECGQPLHAFDFAKLRGGRIVVRPSRPGEKFTAINHVTYELAEGTCVIADAERAVALGGVMGGADTEVSEATVDVLIEAAEFDPLSIRRTARRHGLHSPSSYGFERGVDPEGVDWASRRCCELILETAGGTLCEGVIDVGRRPVAREIVKLRWDQLPRVLGIAVARDRVQAILAALGCRQTHVCDKCVKVEPPSWRADLSREIDLIEEVARIHGYDQIPEDVGVKMAASTRTRSDRVLDVVRSALTAAGFDEAMTLSAVDEAWIEAFRPWRQDPPLRTSTPVLRRADCLRQTLVPSLLAARRHNEKLSNPVVELFEIASVYWPEATGLPTQRRMLALCSGRDFAAVKGVLETLIARLVPSAELSVEPTSLDLLDPVRAARLSLDGRPLGVVGEVSEAGRRPFELRGPATVAEIDLDLLIERAELIRKTRPLSPFPPVSRDLNLVADESIRWQQVERLVRAAGGDQLEAIAYHETYRDPQRLGAGKKSLLFSVQFRSPVGTLTNEEADVMRDRIVELLAREGCGTLRA